MSRTLTGNGISHFRIASPSQLDGPPKDSILFLPYWLLTYEDMVTMMIDRKETNAPNQAMVLARTVRSEMLLVVGKHDDVLKNFTVDSPVPYDINAVLNALRGLGMAKVEGAKGRRTEKAGEFNGRLTQFISRLENKLTDRRLGFMDRILPRTRRSSIGSRNSQTSF